MAKRLKEKVTKKERQQILARVLSESSLSSQGEVVAALTQKGLAITQASVSRDLTDLGVIKVNGVYKAPSIEPGQSSAIDRLHAEFVGKNLVVLKTAPGHAAMVATRIDKAKVAGAVGTIAGDDTIFVAVKNESDQIRVARRILALFQSSH